MTSVIENDTDDVFFCILRGASSGERSRYIAIAGVISTVLSFVPGFGQAVTAAGVYDAYASIKTGDEISDVVFPGGTLQRTACSFTFNTITLFRYSFDDRERLFRARFATKEGLPNDTIKLSEVVFDNAYITIFTKAIDVGKRWESYRVFELQLSPTNHYRPRGQDHSEEEQLHDRCIVSGRGALKKYYTIGTHLPAEGHHVLGNAPLDQDRGRYLLLVQTAVSSSDAITSIEVATTNTALPYEYLWILRGFTIRNSQTETSAIRPSVVGFPDPQETEEKAKELVSTKLTEGYLAFDWFSGSGDDHGKVQGYKLLGAIVRRTGYTAFVVLKSRTVAHRFYQPEA